MTTTGRTAELLWTPSLHAQDGIEVWRVFPPSLDTDGRTVDVVATTAGTLHPGAHHGGVGGAWVLRAIVQGAVTLIDWKRGPLPGSTFDCPPDTQEALAYHLAGSDVAACPYCGTARDVTGLHYLGRDQYAPRLACGHTTARLEVGG